MNTKDQSNNRTHEPSLRELTSQLDDLEKLVNTRFDYVEKIQDERDRLYRERADSYKQNVDNALLATEKQTAASFLASEKAISKAEEAQKTYNQGHNDLSRKMETQYASMVPQSEANLKWNSIDKAIEEGRKEVGALRIAEQADISNLRTELMKEISSLRESRSEGFGKEEIQVQDKNRSIAVIGLLITSIISILTIVAILVANLITQK